MRTTRTREVSAQTHWLNTNVILKSGDTVTITATGTWSANPDSYGDTGADGCDGLSGIPAKDSYTLPGFPESRLVGYVGECAPEGAAPPGVFDIGSSKRLDPYSGSPGRLFLSINDDVTMKYGAGYKDNRGSLQVTIEVDSDG